MASIPQLGRTLKQVFEQDAPRLARQVGMRQRTLSFSHLALLLVLGWWSRPHSGPSALARFAGSLGDTLCKQDVDCHFTERTATWLLALLRCVVDKVVTATFSREVLCWMRPFAGVFVEDGSTISLPPALASVWHGCGGSKPSGIKPGQSDAALKLTVRYDLKGGSLDGPHLQDGRTPDICSVLSQHQMPPGSLWLADLGYWSLTQLQQMLKQGVYFCVRVKVGTIVWSQQQSTDLLSLVKGITREQQEVEWQVDVGASHQLRAMRLLVQRVPESVLRQREQRIHEQATKEGKRASQAALDLAPWTILVCNVPGCLLSCSQAFVLMHVRWQIELLFKLWKQDALVDEWTTTKPWRILCEVYAKLIAMVVQHWLLLLTCWDDPYHSLSGVSEVLREQVPLLVQGLCRRVPLGKVLGLLKDCVKGGCSIPERSTRQSTSHRMQSAFDNS